MARKKAESSEQTTVKKNNKKDRIPKNQTYLDMCSWLEKEIFGYSEDQKLHTAACMRLQGLIRGQGYGNSHVRANGNYSYDVIWNTFKAQKMNILNSMRGKRFNNEAEKMAYACAIVRNNINDMYDRMENAKKSSAKTKSLSIDSYSYNGAEYQSKTDRKNDSKNEELW